MTPLRLADSHPNLRVALVLGGGNALGAYHAGVYQALEEAGVEPQWIVGTSIGAVTGAIIVGNARADRLNRLRRLWRPEHQGDAWSNPASYLPETLRRTGAALETLVFGRTGMFASLGSTAAWWRRDDGAGAPALYDVRALRETLIDLIDFDRLNRGATRFTAVAVDIESGEEAWFDTRDREIGPDHIRASAALISTFPAITIDDRLFGDGGLSMNLPIDPVMAWSEPAPLLCFASDLLPLASQRPRSLGEVLSRTQDLLFAAQSRRTIERWQAVFAAEQDRSRQSITLVNLAYTDQGREVAGKAMDFSPRSVRERWEAGYRDGSQAIADLVGGHIAVGAPGLSVHSATRPG
ncbi:patatin-like phospholipase family protein [Novosphingobium sp. 9U]|uniref:patatin-like phospholipase family protein n=1 Tax=Novosphingobium sp. 9U TaxID=2653158 RepID=UPI001359585B|nr:patatin-like phospholipase family protein [Novosphingobium sp. 9U]